jgi:hypothetical protein
MQALAIPDSLQFTTLVMRAQLRRPFSGDEYGGLCEANRDLRFGAPALPAAGAGIRH